MIRNGTMLPAVWRLDDIGRVDLDFDWNEIDGAVQAVLADLDVLIKKANPTVQISPGHNSAAAWYLFSYRVYSIFGSDIDPVVVGITFSPGIHGTKIRGDIVGESLGDVLFEAAERERDGELVILETARDMAEELVGYAQAVADAIMNPARNN